MTKKEMLQDNPLYRLDSVMVDHLGKYLLEAIGEPFDVYRMAYEAQMLHIEDEIKQRGKLIGIYPKDEDISDTYLAEPTPEMRVQVSKELGISWRILSKELAEPLQELCSLFSACLGERWGLEHAATAILVAEESHIEGYAEKVKAAVNLAQYQVPLWWSMNRRYIHKYFNVF